MADTDDLLVRWELGLTDAADEAALMQALDDPAVRRALVRNARVAAALGAPASISAPPASERIYTSGTTRQRKAFRLRTGHPPRWPRFAVAASVALVAGVIALLLVTARPPATPAAPLAKPVAQAKPVFARLVAGNTRITGLDGRPGGARDAGLLPGDSVVAITDARLVLGHDAAHLDLAAGAHLVLPLGVDDPTTNAVPLLLANGRVTAEVAPRRSGAPFIIATPLARAEVVGTRFSLAVDAKEARLVVEHGAVHFSTPSDNGTLVAAGRSAVASEGLVSIAPPAPGAETPLPADAEVLWRTGTGNPQGWRGVVDTLAGDLTAWRSVAPRPGDVWSGGEIRTPVTKTAWTVRKNTWLRFRYHVERFSPGLALEVHLKPEDESNYAFRLTTDTSDGWHEALLRVDGVFRHLSPERRPLAVGEQIHGAVWCAMQDGEKETTAARFWVRDVVVFTSP